jgi:hypothetical protein
VFYGVEIFFIEFEFFFILACSERVGKGVFRAGSTSTGEGLERARRALGEARDPSRPRVEPARQREQGDTPISLPRMASHPWRRPWHPRRELIFRRQEMAGPPDQEHAGNGQRPTREPANDGTSRNI